MRTSSLFYRPESGGLYFVCVCASIFVPLSIPSAGLRYPEPLDGKVSWSCGKYISRQHCHTIPDGCRRGCRTVTLRILGRHDAQELKKKMK